MLHISEISVILILVLPNVLRISGWSEERRGKKKINHLDHRNSSGGVRSKFKTPPLFLPHLNPAGCYMSYNKRQANIRKHDKRALCLFVFLFFVSQFILNVIPRLIQFPYYENVLDVLTQKVSTRFQGTTYV